MPGAVIVIDQTTGAGPGTPGVARNDLWELQEVTLHVGTTGNTTYQWDLLNRPAGSIAEITNPLSETATFVPDMVGTYRLRLVVNGGGAGNVQILVARVRYDSTGALKNRGWAYPAVGEQEGENNYPGNERSWSQIVEYILEDIRVNGMGGGGLGATYLALVAGVQSAGAVYKIIGALPTIDYGALGVSSLVLAAMLNIPAGSTAQVRLYDKTNASTVWESDVIAGPQTGYELSQPVTPAAGASLLEFWLSTPTDDGGDASCLTAGFRAAR